MAACKIMCSLGDIKQQITAGYQGAVHIEKSATSVPSPNLQLAGIYFLVFYSKKEKLSARARRRACRKITYQSKFVQVTNCRHLFLFLVFYSKKENSGTKLCSLVWTSNNEYLLGTKAVHEKSRTPNFSILQHAGIFFPWLLLQKEKLRKTLTTKLCLLVWTSNNEYLMGTKAVHVERL
jgi:hypothetical protein